MAVQLLITDANLKPVTDPIVTWTHIEATRKFNEVGSGTFSAPYSKSLIAAVNQPGNRVRLMRNGKTFSSGLIEKPGGHTRSAAPDGDGAGLGSVTVQWADTLEVLTRRITYPDPALAGAGQTTVEAWTATAVNAETVLRNLVNLNIGPGARVERRHPNLVLGPTQGVGTAINVYTKFETLIDALRNAAVMGGLLGFTLDDTGSQLVFGVYAPADRTKTVRFSFGLNNLRSYTTDPDAPTATVAIVGGSGTSVNQTRVERSNTAAVNAGWGRLETYVNGPSTADTTVLNPAGDGAATTEKAEKLRLTVQVIETPDLLYGIHYQLGDKVSLQLTDGTATSDLVTAVTLTADPVAGELLVPTIGSEKAYTDTDLILRLREVEQRIAMLERR